MSQYPEYLKSDGQIPDFFKSEPFQKMLSITGILELKQVTTVIVYIAFIYNKFYTSERLTLQYRLNWVGPLDQIFKHQNCFNFLFYIHYTFFPITVG